MANPTKDQQKPLVYHLAGRKYGRGVCGTYGMMADRLNAVTCDRCKRSAAFQRVVQQIRGES